MKLLTTFWTIFSLLLLMPDSTCELAHQIASHAAYAEVKCEDNHVKQLFFSNHSQFEKKNSGAPGITDEEMEEIATFDSLISFKIEMQRVTSQGCELLKKCAAIEELMFHYMDKKFADQGVDSLISPDFMLVANHFKDQLKVLEIKHHFKLKNTRVNELQPMPHLKRLVLDNASADTMAYPFILSCPEIEELELHRTKITNRQLMHIADSLQNIQWLWIRPEKGSYPDKIDYRVLKQIGQLKALEELMLKLNFGKVPFENGLEHLVPLEKLKMLKLEKDVEMENVYKFRKARPDVEIIIGYTKLT